MKRSTLEKLMKTQKASVDLDESQPQTRQVIATAGTIKIRVEGKSNGKTDN
jgi:hypothetical protein